MPSHSAAGEASIRRRLGHEGWLAYLAKKAAKKRLDRAKKRLADRGESMPTNPIDIRRVLGGHPMDCPCASCLWGEDQPDDRPGCRIARWPERVRL